MKSLSLTFAMILAGAVTSIAGTSVWSVDKKTGNDMQPARWGDVYANPEGRAKGELKLTDEGYVFSTELVLNSGTYSSAGFSIVWKRSGSADLSSYSGLCLTYKADRPFRVDFKQPSVTDYNFHGVVLPAQDSLIAKYIDFRNLEQEGGWGEKVSLDLVHQDGVQINYKEGIAGSLDESDANRTKNVITVSAVSLGECEEVVVEEDTLKVLAPYDEVQSVTIKDTDTLKIDLKKVFAASKADETKITPTMTRAVLNQVKPTGAPTIKDEIFYVPTGIDKDTTLSLIFIASNGAKSAIATIEVTIQYSGSGPVGPVCPGDPSCPVNPENHPTKLLAPYNDGKPVVLDTMPETDTLRIPLGKLFADEDNDKLTFVVTMSVPLMKNLTALDKVTLNDALVIVPSGVKADTSLTVTVSATDGKSDLVKVDFVVRIKDSNTPPVAKVVEYEAHEDLALIVSTSNGIATKGGSDLDGDDFLVILVDSTKYGELSGFSQMGSFTYKPKLNYHGDDTLTYVLVETSNYKMRSAVTSVIIHVLPVNDAPTFVIADSTFLKDTISLDMDFDEDTVPAIKVPTKSLVFSDLEVTEGTQKLTYRAKGTNIEATVDSVNASYYFISVKPVTNASGNAAIFLYAWDGADSAGVNIPVKLVSPKDLAHAENDEYTAFNDTVLVVDAKKGVLANDVYPEGMTTGMTAEIAQNPGHGTLTLNKDGSFTYKSEAGYVGIDRFGYYDVINGTKSKAAIVTISVEKRNQPPAVVVKAQTLDTTVVEDFPTSKALKYTKSVVASWFKDPEGDSLTFTAKSKDGKLKVGFTDAGVLEIYSVPDSSGKSYVVVTADDKKSSSKSFEFCVTITAVNDKPVLLHGDTAHVSTSGWTAKWKLDTLVKDVDGDKLEFVPNETSALAKYMTISLKGTELTATAVDGVKFKMGQKFALGVNASDPSKASVTIPLYIIVDVPEGLNQQLAQPKLTWQNAVMAKRGTVSIMDMQGRKVWSAKLPVNPAEVMNASAQVQGRKILRVNNQTWTIK